MASRGDEWQVWLGLEMELPDKQRVFRALVDALASSLQQLTNAAEEVRRDATHEEARPENDKDTRALEQTYLARGQAIRAEALVEQLKLLRSMSLPKLKDDDAICAGALIALEDDEGATRCIFLAPYGGGETVVVDQVSVLVVTPVSALGRALLGKQSGDEFELNSRGKMRSYSIVDVV